MRPWPTANQSVPAPAAERGTAASTYMQLMAFFADPAVDELLLNGAAELWILSGAQAAQSTSPFAHTSAMLAWVQEFAKHQGVRLDPMAGAAGGTFGTFRWHCILPPLSPDGPLLSLRRHRFEQLALADFGGPSGLKTELGSIMQRRENLLLVGPTGCGKTTLLAALIKEFAAKERVIICESLPELPRVTPQTVRLLERSPNLEGVGGVSLSRLLFEAMRMRPDRLVVGEIRSHEAKAFKEALLTGHSGVLATLHANGPEDVAARLAQLTGEAADHRLGLRVAVLERGEPPSLARLADV